MGNSFPLPTVSLLYFIMVLFFLLDCTQRPHIYFLLACEATENLMRKIGNIATIVQDEASVL